MQCVARSAWLPASCGREPTTFRRQRCQTRSPHCRAASPRHDQQACKSEIAACPAEQPTSVSIGTSVAAGLTFVSLLGGLMPPVATAAVASSAATAAAAASVARPVFEPRLDMDILIPQLVVLALTGGAAAYWWWVVVPSARASLAKDKRKGEVREYLGDLEADPSRRVERWFYDDWLQQLRRRKNLNAWGAKPSTSDTPGGGASAGRGSEGGPSVEASPADPMAPETDLLKPSLFTPEPRFWSPDNPIVATGALVLAVVGVATALHGGP